MADVTVWEGGDVKCKVRLEGVKYKSTTSVKFVFQRKDNDEQIGTKTAEVKSPFLGSKTAECVWNPPDTKDAELYYIAKYHLEIDGVAKTDVPQDIYVWAKEMTVTAKKPDDNAFKGAICVFFQEVPDKLQKKMDSTGKRVPSVTAQRRADAQGKIKYTLQVPADVTTTFERPYQVIGSWTVAAGRKREAKVKQGFKVKIDWPVADLTSGEHAQWVNMDADVNHPDRGATLKLKISSMFAYPGQAGDTVHIKAKFDGANSDRTARDGEHAKGAEVATTVKLDANKKAEFELLLGPAGGDKVTINVGATVEANDATIVVRSWRRLYYQLKGPDFISSGLPAKTLPDGTQGYDLPNAVTAQVKHIMDKTYTTYEVLKSFAHAANLYPAYQRHASAYLGQTAGSTMLVQTTKDYNTDQPTAFAPPDARTILMKLCNEASNGKTKLVTVEKSWTKARDYVGMVNDYKVRAFFKLLEDGTDAVDVTGCEWEADVTGLDPGTVDAPGPDAAHPAFDNFVPRKGAMDKTWIRPNNWAWVEVRLPTANATDPGSFAGTQGTALKCPIKFKFFMTVPAGWVNGCALGNRQLMCMKPASPKCVASVLCHELGHTMGMTIMPGRNQVPYGLPAAKHVDNGGDYYRNKSDTEVVGNGLRTSHQGAHCAAGIGDKTPDSLASMDGTCSMYGEGGNDDLKAPDGFCATCIKYIKARNLDDIQTSFQTRAAEDC